MVTRSALLALILSAGLLPLCVQAQSFVRADGSAEAGSYVEVDHGPIAQFLGEVVSLTHSASDDLEEGTIACVHDGLPQTTRENQFLRRFNLPDFDVENDLVIDSVLIGVQQSLNDSGPFDLLFNFYTLDGSFTYANMDLLGSEVVRMPITEIQMEHLVLDQVEDVTVPADFELVVEVAAPDLIGTGRFFMGSNAQGETDDSYIASASCGANDPTPYAELGPGFPDVHLVMTVYGHTEIVSSEGGPAEVRHVRLGQSYPNPLAAGSRAVIPFEVNEATDVRLAVFDALGRQIALVEDATYAPGSHEAALDVSDLLGGTYMVRLEAGGEVQSRSLVVMR